MADRAGIWIDGKTYEVDPSRDLLDVCLGLGFDLPYFCWHPAMGSVGACRQCAVKQYKDENDDRGKLVMACMTPAADGTRISIRDADARDFRASVSEWLMVNHPHDCPICDEGGECHLQDMTVMAGHVYRRYRFRKRTYRNQYLGPLINHEMNRCIQCYRCVRFYHDHAGGRDLQAFAAHDHVYFGRHEEGILESEFSGNLVEVCPTGVFTDKTSKHHYSRKWDQQIAPSICVHCGLGCNTVPGERYGVLRRIRARYHDEVNGYCLCDRGRYGYEFVNDERRFRRPLLPRGPAEPAVATDEEDATQRFGQLLADSRKVIGIGSPRASLEANFVLRSIVGAERFYLGVPGDEARALAAILEILRGGKSRTPSLREVESCDAVLVLGEDVADTAPMLALALRQSVRNQPLAIADRLKIPRWQDAAVREALQSARGPLAIATPAPTRIDEIASTVLRAAPEDIARLGFAVAHALDPDVPSPGELDDETMAAAREMAAALRDAKRPLVISGVGLRDEHVIRAAANVAWAAGKSRGGEPAELIYAVPEVNSLGLAMLGGEPLERAFTELPEDIETVVVLENDLFRRARAPAVEKLLGEGRHVIVIDAIAHATAARAELVLPAATFAESDGTFVSSEGRGQRFYQVFVPEGSILESWRWMRDAMEAADRAEAVSWTGLDAVIAQAAEEIPALRDLTAVAPAAGFRVNGERVPRQPHRYSGRTSMHAAESVHEPKPPDDPDSPFSFSMEGYEGIVPGALTADFWAPGWNSIQSLNKFQIEIGGPLRGGDPGIRFVEPAERDHAYFEEVPAPFARRPDLLRVVPLHHVFGSEELSNLAPGIAELAPSPYAALHPEDAEGLGLALGDDVELRSEDGLELRLPVTLQSDLPRGVVGIPVGLAGVDVLPLPAWMEGRKP